MSELPEIEATRRILTPLIVGKKVDEVSILRPDRLSYPDADALTDAIMSEEIDSLERTGKFLKFSMKSGGYFLMHFRMRGRVQHVPKGSPETVHTIAVLGLDDDTELRMTDSRCLSLVWYVSPDDENVGTGIEKLGRDALDGDIDADYLKSTLGRKERNLKTCILDQHTIAGIGNMYADEILFEAGISPLRQASSLSDHEYQRLAKVIPRVLRLAIDRNMSNPERLQTESRTRARQPDFAASAKRGMVCRKCGESLVRVKVGGRSTVYCPKCQK